jgi:hypothetical protein
MVSTEYLAIICGTATFYKVLIIHILCYMDTVDEKWVKDALEGFDQSKIMWKNFNVTV